MYSITKAEIKTKQININILSNFFLSICLFIFIAKFLILNLETKIQTITFIWYTFLIISGFLIGQVTSVVSNNKQGMVLKFAPLYGVSMVLLGMLFFNVIILKDLLNLFGVASVLIALAMSVRKF